MTRYSRFFNNLQYLLMTCHFSDCTENIGTISALSGPISCNVPSQCSAVDCCVHVDFLKRSFHAVVNIEPCERKFVITIENLQLDLSYLSYQWGRMIFCLQ